MLEWRVGLIVSHKTARLLNSQTMNKFFGEGSPFKEWAQETLFEHYKKHKTELNEVYENWKNLFMEIYPEQFLTIDLFIQHIYFILIVKNVVSHLIRQDFSLIPLDFSVWAQKIKEIEQRIATFLRGVKINVGDIFNRLYEELISPNTRLMLGEYYTPFSLAEKVVKETYTPGARVLDPSCGSGTFLLALVNKILNSRLTPKKQDTALQNLFGMDINPIAVFTTRANLTLHTVRTTSQSLTDNVVWDNFLFPNDVSNFFSLHKTSTDFPSTKHMGNEKFDLVIGNPPWVVLSGIRSSSYKASLRNLARHFGLLPRARNLPNIEVSALFLYQSIAHSLRDGGIVAFLISNAIINGSQHNGTRSFLNMDHIRIWRFSRDLFRIHNICFIARKNINASRVKYPSVIVTHYDVLSKDRSIEFIESKNEEYTPIKILRRLDGIRKGAEKLIPVSSHKNLLPRLISKKNYYFAHCRKGADLYPRSLIFVNILNQTRNLVHIEPKVQNHVKMPWNFRPFDKAIVEPDHIFYTVKSDVSVPFVILDRTPVFLPITFDTFLDFDGTSAKVPNLKARKHYEQLASIYKTRQLQGKKPKELWENLNFRKKLTHSDQLAPLKVVTPASAGFVKAALIRKPGTIIDVSLYYVPVPTIEEGHYLLGILNAPCVAEDVRIRSSEGAGGGVRNLHKRPWEINIPIYDSEDGLHAAIQKLGSEMELKARKIAFEWRKKEYMNTKGKQKPFNSIKEVKWKKLVVQKLIISDLTHEYNVLNKLVRELLTSTTKAQ
ncbi:MAG: class I SAM-dependent DNA methyltransferase [Candidatus Heimdallarchaeota archaeon]